ncbi:Uridine nucleosidase 1 [Tilletia horrida]|nr:Uridine nucleosidase 1 [Tilletia horrida]
MYGRSASGSTGTPGQQERTPLWLDCDPGHDDACALLLAIHHPSLDLLGVSTVGGNAPGASTCANAAQLLVAFGAPESVELWRGSDLPLLKAPRHGDVAIHGEGGLGGVTGLPILSDPSVQRRFTGPRSSFYSAESSLIPPHEPAAVVNRLAELVSARMRERKPKLHIAITGPCTNIALFCKMYPHLLAGVEQIVLMGGVAGGAGNRGPLAEFNILCDPEAAAIVFDADIKTVMAGLNVTHTAIFTRDLHARLLKGTNMAPIPAGGPSPVRVTLSSILTFFASTYASEFGFVLGPPVHDSLALMYIIEPQLFWTYGTPATAIHGRRQQPNPYLANPLPKRARQGSRAGAGAGGDGGDNDEDDDDDDDDDNDDVEHIETKDEMMYDRLRTDALEPWFGWDRPMIPPVRYRVQVECTPRSLAEGATVVDWWGNWGFDESAGWGRGGKNVEVLEEVDTRKMWDIFFEVVDRAESVLHPSR